MKITVAAIDADNDGQAAGIERGAYVARCGEGPEAGHDGNGTHEARADAGAPDASVAHVATAGAVGRDEWNSASSQDIAPESQDITKLRVANLSDYIKSPLQPGPGGGELPPRYRERTL